MSPAEFLFRGLGLPLPDAAPVACPPGTHCPLTGLPLLEGYPVQSIVPSSTGEWLDLLRGDVHGYLSPQAASCIQNDWNLGNRALFQRPDGTFEAHYPLLARPKPGAVIEPVDEATADPKRLKTLRRDGQGVRPCWSDLLKTLPSRQGWPCLLIVAADPKKRVWNRARVGSVGEQTPFLLFDSSRSLLNCVSVPAGELLKLLDLVETIYTAGFTKAAMERFLPSETKAVSQVGLAQALAWERALAPYRSLPWFLLVTLCAQRHEAPAPASLVPTTAPKATAKPPKATAKPPTAGKPEAITDTTNPQPSGNNPQPATTNPQPSMATLGGLFDV